MGAKMVVRSEFTEEAYSEIESSGVSVAASAQLSYASFASGSVSSETESEREHREEFESKRSLHSEAYLGSHPPSDGNWQTWATSSEESSFPVVYKLVPIVSLLEEKFFPDMPEGNLTTRRHLLAGAYDIYCSSTAECQTPGQDRKPILTSKVATRIHGTAKVACVNGYNLLSCGMQANTKSKGYDLKRHAVPHSSTECECSDQHDSQCIPWCTNANVNFEIKHSSVHGSADVYCPHGYKVLGCGAKHHGPEKWSQVYPHLDGRGCHCYNYYGVQCIASSASNIRNYEVRHQYGTHTFTVTCSPGNYVLGCGIKPLYYHGIHVFEKFRAWEVVGDDKCQCYDRYGTTCYATCGQLTDL